MDDTEYLAENDRRCKDCGAPLPEDATLRYCDECYAAFMVGRGPVLVATGRAA